MGPGQAQVCSQGQEGFSPASPELEGGHGLPGILGKRGVEVNPKGTQWYPGILLLGTGSLQLPIDLMFSLLLSLALTPAPSCPSEWALAPCPCPQPLQEWYRMGWDGGKSQACVPGPLPPRYLCASQEAAERQTNRHAPEITPLESSR